MKLVKYISISMLIAASLASFSNLHAQPYITFDARSMGMGGTSVASSQLADAAYSNPAMVSEPVGGENFQLILPVVGVNINDPDGLIDDVEQFNNAIDNNNQVGAALALLSSLGKPLTVSANAGGAFGFAVDKFAMVFIYNKQFLFDLRTRPAFIPTNAELEGVGVELSEIGVAMPLYANGNFKFGVTPKLVGVKSYDYSQLLIDVANGSGVTTDLGEVAHGTSFNLDAGASYDFNNGLVLGIVVRNINSQEYTTRLNKKIKLDSQMRAGVAYNGDLFTVALDADITKNDPIAFSDKTQLITLGAEFNFFDWIAIRVGHQKNTASTDKESMNSIGLGFTPFGIGVDLSAIGNSHAIGGALQLSFTF